MADGSITINTKIDQSGFKTGTKQLKSGMNGITSSLKGLAAAAGIAFGTAALINFGKQSLKTASDFKSAMTGLQSIVDGQGRSFSQAQGFINDYISDGLVPVTNAVTTYKNLLMRGYSTDQIESVMTALKNSSAFGRQASLTMGEAVQSATEGLKNENSILVDNSGVTKNVSVMWKEYAATIGVGVDSLTKQQKIQAEVTGIMQETRFQMGDAAKLAGTYAGQVQQLGFNFNNLKIAVGNALMPIAQAVLPSINAMITGFTRLANIFAQVSTALFGKANQQQQVASTATSAAKSTDTLAASTTKAAEAQKKANKETQNAISGLDELNIINQETADSTSGSADAADSGAGSAISAVTDPLSGEIGGNIEISPKVAQVVEKIKALFEPIKSINLDNLKDAFARLKTALDPFTENIFEGLKWFWDNILVPYASWSIEDALPAFLDLLSSQLSVLNAVIDALKPLGEWLWDVFLKPFLSWVGDKYIEWLNLLTDGFYRVSDWIKENQKAVETIAIIIGSFAAAFGLVNLAIGIWNVIGAIATGVTSAFGAAVAFLTSPVTLVILAIGALIAIIVLLVKNWDSVKEAAGAAWNWIKTTWSGAADWLSTKVFEPIGRFFTGLWDGAKSGFIAFINFIIHGINNLIAGFLSPINLLISGWNSTIGKVTAKIPNINISIPEIPKLATGAVIPPGKEFLAILGDQKSGTNIETPLNTMVQAFKMALADSGSGQQSSDVQLNLNISSYLDGDVVYTNQEKIRARRGTQTVLSGAFAR